MSLNQELSEDNLRVIERFIVLMYDLTSLLITVNECRRGVFAKKSRSVELIPPTQDTLVQHIKRVLSQYKYVKIRNVYMQILCMWSNFALTHIFQQTKR